MNSGSFSGVWALASRVSVTSKVLASNCRVDTFTFSVSCGCFCSIRLCGARGFSKLRSLMYWPCRVSGVACSWGAAVEPGGGVGVSVILLLSLDIVTNGARLGDRAGGTMQGCAAQGAGSASWQAIAN